MTKTYLNIIVAMLLTAPIGSATLIAPRSLTDLTAGADSIVVGTAMRVSQGGNGVSLTLAIDRVLKGDVGMNGTIASVLWVITPADAAQAVTPTAASGPGIWFLQRASGGWTLLPVMQGSVPLSTSYFPVPPGPLVAAYAYGAASPLADKLACELGSAIESANGSYSIQMRTLHYGLLDQLGSSYVPVLYQRLAASASPAQRLLGLAGLIRGGSSGALVGLGQSASTLVANPKEGGTLLLSIRDYFRSTDTMSLNALAQLEGSSDTNGALREAAAHALAAIHTVGTLPSLAALLDDVDSNLRAEAIGGLGSFANGLAIQTTSGVPSLAFLQFPASAPYLTPATKANFALGTRAIERNEASYLAFWKQWWAQNRAALGF